MAANRPGPAQPGRPSSLTWSLPRANLRLSVPQPERANLLLSVSVVLSPHRSSVPTCCCLSRSPSVPTCRCLSAVFFPGFNCTTEHRRFVPNVFSFEVFGGRQ